MSRTVVITGAGGGLGSIFAKEFAKTGYRVAILDFNIQAGQKMLRCSTLAAMKC